MSDLISRSALRQEILEKMPQGSKRGVFLAFVDDQPTAYDTDKVVEQLEEKRLIKVEQCHEDYESEVMTESNFDDAIDIVKGGGISENN